MRRRRFQLRQLGGALAREAPGAGARATLPGEPSMYVGNHHVPPAD